MHIISKQKVQIGDVVVEPNKVTFLPDTAKEDHYFKLCKKSEYFQIIEAPKQEEEKAKKAKKEA
jgi:hypothetical protein